MKKSITSQNNHSINFKRYYLYFISQKTIKYLKFCTKTFYRGSDSFYNSYIKTITRYSHYFRQLGKTLSVPILLNKQDFFQRLLVAQSIPKRIHPKCLSLFFLHDQSFACMSMNSLAFLQTSAS